MTVAFIPARDLKLKYRVLGHFYSLHVPQVELIKCRSVLEITSNIASQNPTADAVFVMMNPGSSRAVEETDNTVLARSISVMSALLVPTVPDTTQYQIMRIMHYTGWQHVRVINLSDLRDPNSGVFSQRYTQLERESGSTVHSVFSSERATELKGRLSRKPGSPLICAWGVNDNLKPLIDRATKSLASETNVCGLVKAGHPGKYFHPLPLLQQEKKQWVIQLLSQLNCPRRLNIDPMGQFSASTPDS